jgi:Prolyl oligopeptidase family
MFRTIYLLPWLAGAALLTACGGGNDNGSPPAATAPTRGQLLNSPPPLLASYSTSDLLSKLGNDPLGKELLQLTFSPTCTVNVCQLQYETVGGAGEATTASGALMVPTGSGPSCQGPRPIMLYAHGTNLVKTYNIADLTNSANSEGLLLAAVFAAQGYIVVAPNYAGYDSSSLAYHPYLNADQQSKDMIDSLAAARTAFTTAMVTGNGKLFVTGYSQGGFVAMATHRAMQTLGTAVTAAAPMSGPYALSAFGDAIFMGQVDMSAPANFDLLVTSYQHAYGNIYTNPTDVFEAAYATGIDALLPSTTDINTLNMEGKLPKSALFNSTPPSPAYAAITPATMPANLAPSFALGFGTGNLVTNAYRLAYLQDAATAPDGGFPTTTTDVPPAAPANTLRQALKTNDLRDWAPTAPVLLCAGDSDPTVFYLNTQLIQGYWAANAPGSSVTVLDVDSASSSGDPYATLKDGFAAAKAAVQAAAVAGGATDGGAMAVLQDYHAGLVPPFCLSAVKAFFDAH